MKRRETTSGETLVSVLVECGVTDHKTVIGMLAERHDGDSWLACQLVERGLVNKDDMETALKLIEDLRSGNPFRMRRARVDMVKLRQRALDKYYAANAQASAGLREQTRRISDHFPAVKADKPNHG